MGPTARKVFLLIALAGLVSAAAWAASFGALPPADFTFCNGTEIKTVDPAIVSGQPEGKVIEALFEGLTNWNAKTLVPGPGVAKSWDVSDDGRVYTFHLRDDARWSNGRPITADDFRYSYRRFLDPLTGAEYAYQLWYVTNGKKYTVGPLEPGDHVEVELKKPADALNTVRGELLRGELMAIEERAEDGSVIEPKPPANGETGEETPAADTTKTYVVRLDGKERRFSPDGVAGAEPVERVLFDFDEVGIKALDKHTLEITLDSPTPYFLSLVGFYPLSPVNRECVETHGYPAWTKPENLVTNGPYRLAWRRIRDRIRLEKSDSYWDRDRVRLNVVDVLAVSGETTMLNLYLTGQTDWINTVPQSAIPELLAQNRADFQPKPVLATYFYRLNVTRPPLNDPRVRRALSLAMNREEIVTKITRAGEVPAYSLVPPGLTGYERALCADENLAEAKRLLAEAGYPEGRGLPPVEIMYNTSEGHQKIAEMLQAQWKRGLGIDVRLKNQEWAAYLSASQKLDYTICRSAWYGDYADPNTFLDMFVSGGTNNQTGWENAEYDRLIHDAAREVDPARRMETLRAAEAILMREQPIIPIYFYVDKNMIAGYVDDFHRNPQDFHPAQTLAIDQEKKRAELAARGLAR